MSGRRNRTRCRDSVTVQPAPLISLFVLPSSSTPPHPPGSPLLSYRARGDKYYRDCDIRAIPRVAIYVTRSRDSRLRSRLLGDGDARGRGEKVRGSREKRTRREARGGEGGEDAPPETTHTLVLERGCCIDRPNFDSGIKVEFDEARKERRRLRKIQARAKFHPLAKFIVARIFARPLPRDVSLFATRFKVKSRRERAYIPQSVSRRCLSIARLR